MTTFVKDTEDFWKPINNAAYLLAIIFLIFSAIFHSDIFTYGKIALVLLCGMVLWIKKSTKFSGLHFVIVSCSVFIMFLSLYELNNALVIAGIVVK